MQWPELTPNNVIAFAVALFMALSLSALYAAPLQPTSPENETTTTVGDTVTNTTGAPQPRSDVATEPKRYHEQNCTNVSTHRVTAETGRTQALARSPLATLGIQTGVRENTTAPPGRAGSAASAGVGNDSRQSLPAGLRGICQLADLYSAPAWVDEIAATAPATRADTASVGPTPSLENYSDTSPRAAAHLALARDLQDILTSDYRSRREATLDAASRTLAAGQQQVEEGRLNDSLAPTLAAEQTKLQGARTLLDRSESTAAGPPGSITRATALASVGIKLQTAEVGTAARPTDPTEVRLPSTSLPNHDTPSAAAFAILEARNVEATPEQSADIRALNELPQPTRGELTDVLDAYLAYYRTTQAANGTEVAHVRAAQLELLDAAGNLQRALGEDGIPGRSGPASHRPGTSHVAVEGVVSIDLDRTDDTYESDYAVQVDVGGDDTYTNNAGGAQATGNATDAAALIDFAGADTYRGRNGGGWYNRTASPSGPWHTRTPKEGEAAGFLLDAGTGDDVYRPTGTPTYLQFRWGKVRYKEAKPGSLGTNGGAKRGIGFLVDTGGSDTYDAGGKGTNGGGDRTGVGFLLDVGTGDDVYRSSGGVTNGGSREGQGFLFDGGGTDTYDAAGGGSNGGGAGGIVGIPVDLPGPYIPYVEKFGDPVYRAQVPQKGGFLLDAGGTDAYHGTNGGASYRGIGFLLDAGTANDTYDGTNGGAGRRGAVGMLIDTGGSDDYLAGNDGTNGGAVHHAIGILVDGGTGADTYDATTEGRPGARSNLKPGSVGTNGGGSAGGQGVLVDGGGSDEYIAGSVGTNGGAVRREAERPNSGARQYGTSSGLLLDAAGNDTYRAEQAGVNGGGGAATALLFDAAGTDFYKASTLHCRDCSDVPKGFVGAQVDLVGSESDARSVPGSANVLVVDDGLGSANSDCSDAAYESIQDAVEAAESGDTVRVCAGTYPGNVTIDTTGVTLQAADRGEVVLDGEGKRRFGVALVAGKTAVKGVRATNFKAAFLAIAPSTTVAHTTVTDSTSGIIARGLFTDSPLQESPVGGEEETTTIRDNTVTGGTFGIRVTGTGNINISSNTVRATRYGIVLSGSAEVAVLDNTVTATSLAPSIPQRGISSVRSSEVTISENLVKGFTAPANRTRQMARSVPFGHGYGIEILNPAGVGEDASHTLQNNTMADNTYNLQVYSTRRGAYQHMNIGTSNTVDGEPVLYLVGAANVTIGPGPTGTGTGTTDAVGSAGSTSTTAAPGITGVDDPGYVACVQCVDVTVRNLTFSHNGQGVLIANSRGMRVANVTVHDTFEGIAVHGSPTNTVVTDNTIRESYVAVHARHNCGDTANKGFPMRQLRTGNLAVCANPSLVISNNDIRKTGWVFDRHHLKTYFGLGRSFRGYGGAISVTGTGVIVRENHITDAMGAGISMRVRPPSGFFPGFLDEGIKLNTDAVVDSTVVDNTVSDAFLGISIVGSQGTTISGNTVTDTWVGLFNEFNRGLTYRNNTVRDSRIGIHIGYSDLDYRLRDNTFQDVDYGLHVPLTLFSKPPRAPASHDIGPNNMVNGERIIWLTGAAHRTIDAEDANMVVCVRCVDVTIRDMTLTDNAHGAVLWESTNSTIRNVSVVDTTLSAGIVIRGGQNNVVRDTTIIDSSLSIIALPIEGRRTTKEQRESVGPIRLINNHIAVDDARVKIARRQMGYQHPASGWTEYVIPAHMGIWLMNPTVVTATGNTILDNRWGIVQTTSRLFPDGCPGPKCEPPAMGYDMQITNNTIRHAREPQGMDRNNGEFVPPLGITKGIMVNPNFDTLPNARIVIRHNNISARVIPHSGRNSLDGITINAMNAPDATFTVTDNRVRGYGEGVVVGNRFTNTSVDIRRNRLIEAKSASVVVGGSTPGTTVDIHQNLLNPAKFGYGVTYGGRAMKGGHSAGSGSQSDMADSGHPNPVDATCNRWGEPNGPSSQRMTLTDPVTGEPADGNGSAVSQGHMHHVSNVHFHPWLGESPERTCTEAAVGTATPTPPPTPTRTPWPSLTPGGTGPGPGPGTGPGPGPGPGSGNNTGNDIGGGGEGTRTITAPAPATATPSATPPPTATPEIVPGFGVGIWLVGFVLLVAVLAVRRRE